jgi:coatomer subunit beta
VTSRLIEKLNEIKSGKVFRGVLWILGEYIETVPDIQSAMQEIRKVLGEIPILASEQKLLDDVGGEEDDASSPKVETGGGKPKVLADGTYATETAYSSTTTARLEAVRAASKPPLRSEPLLSSTFTLPFMFCSVVTWRGLFHGRCARIRPHETRSPL